MININANEFNSRQELDEYVKNTHGEDIEANRQKDVQIVGTDDELARLQLSSRVNVYGIKICHDQL